MQTGQTDAQASVKQRSGPVLAVLLAVSFAHLLNDTIQAVISAIYPLLKESFQLTFGQVGLITLTFQLTASILQPIVGLYADHRPVPFSLAAGMGVTLLGLILLSVAGSYALLLVAAGLIGMGSSIFHPEASRVARLASGLPALFCYYTGRLESGHRRKFEENDPYLRMVRERWQEGLIRLVQDIPELDDLKR
jgi:MFS transporter, FSR family, fosmidomycin resistance protein